MSSLRRSSSPSSPCGLLPRHSSSSLISLPPSSLPVAFSLATAPAPSSPSPQLQLPHLPVAFSLATAPAPSSPSRSLAPAPSSPSFSSPQLQLPHLLWPSPSSLISLGSSSLISLTAPAPHLPPQLQLPHLPVAFSLATAPAPSSPSPQLQLPHLPRHSSSSLISLWPSPSPQLQLPHLPRHSSSSLISLAQLLISAPAPSSPSPSSSSLISLPAPAPSSPSPQLQLPHLPVAFSLTTAPAPSSPCGLLSLPRLSSSSSPCGLLPRHSSSSLISLISLACSSSLISLLLPHHSSSSLISLATAPAPSSPSPQLQLPHLPRQAQLPSSPCWLPPSPSPQLQPPSSPSPQLQLPHLPLQLPHLPVAFSLATAPAPSSPCGLLPHHSSSSLISLTTAPAPSSPCGLHSSSSLISLTTAPAPSSPYSAVACSSAASSCSVSAVFLGQKRRPCPPLRPVRCLHVAAPPAHGARGLSIMPRVWIGVAAASCLLHYIGSASVEGTLKLERGNLTCINIFASETKKRQRVGHSAHGGTVHLLKYSAMFEYDVQCHVHTFCAALITLTGVCVNWRECRHHGQTVMAWKNGRALPTDIRQRVFENGTLVVMQTMRQSDGGRYTLPEPPTRTHRLQGRHRLRHRCVTAAAKVSS
ncbi:putative mesoderm induction early response protein 2 isoform X2 [Penaeus vannamei]|uniref:Putative mesoderm induction early response protein 2 isoform X2 n=1 Tax=Penaeus vannamei TaxID=6689 RepID=A0A423SGG2_PENVA|nr:putative mesoderm induction early response protein 2 isoform X2 [Penaeus vannamei]